MPLGAREATLGYALRPRNDRHREGHSQNLLVFFFAMWYAFTKGGMDMLLYHGSTELVDQPEILHDQWTFHTDVALKHLRFREAKEIR